MREKILSLEVLAKKVSKFKENGETVVQCHGCFDVLHFGHLRHFSEAKKHANYLVVTVTPDKFINKGPDRPIFEIAHRVELIAGLEVVDFVAINRWETSIETLELIKPNYYAKGSEYENPDQNVNPNFFLEKDKLESHGGKMVFTYEETSSSSWVAEKIKNL